MNPNRKTVKCETCGIDGELLVVPDGFDDAPTSFDPASIRRAPLPYAVMSMDSASTGVL